jgi:hypothetical protein
MRLFGRRLQGTRFSFKPDGSLAQFGHARLELVPLDQSLSIAVDEAVDGPTNLPKLAFYDIKLEPVWSGLRCVQTALILRQDACRVLQELANLVPDRGIQRLDSKQPSITPELAMESAAIRATAPIIAPTTPMVMAGETISTFLADKQTAE